MNTAIQIIMKDFTWMHTLSLSPGGLLLIFISAYMLCGLAVLGFRKTGNSQLTGWKSIVVALIANIGFYLAGLVTLFLLSFYPRATGIAPIFGNETIIFGIAYFVIYISGVTALIKSFTKFSIIRSGLFGLSCLVLQQLLWGFIFLFFGVLSTVNWIR